MYIAQSDLHLSAQQSSSQELYVEQFRRLTPISAYERGETKSPNNAPTIKAANAEKTGNAARSPKENQDNLNSPKVNISAFGRNLFERFNLGNSLSLASAQNKNTPNQPENNLRYANPEEEADAIAKDNANAIAKDDFEKMLDKDPKMSLLIKLIAALTGREPQMVDLSEMGAIAEKAKEANSSQGVYMREEIGIREVYTESESSSFSASGVVQTADGQTIAFAMQINMERSYSEEVILKITSDKTVKVIDPLTLNFAGSAAELTQQRFSFDLDADGTNDSIHFATRGSGFLVFDKNGDGKINDGKELFGALSGNGFADLAAFDDDKNGWIDEGDKIFNELNLWQKDEKGKDIFLTLKEADVGAISLSNLKTPFTLKQMNGNDQGYVRASGVFLKDTGEVGTVQQVDLTA